jgi:hypothetical protein
VNDSSVFTLASPSFPKLAQRFGNGRLGRNSVSVARAGEDGGRDQGRSASEGRQSLDRTRVPKALR